MSLGAVILCGGESKRMGQPKAWLTFGGERMLQRVVRLVANVVDDVAVVAAPGQELPSLPPSIILARDPVSGRGPLQGLAAGLGALPNRVELAYATATDVPFLEPGWITRLASLIGDQDLAIPHCQGYHHPLAALYRRARVIPAIQALLAANRLRPVFLMEDLPTRVVTEEELLPGRSPTRDIAQPEHPGGVPLGARGGGLRVRGESRDCGEYATAANPGRAVRCASAEGGPRRVDRRGLQPG